MEIKTKGLITFCFLIIIQISCSSKKLALQQSEQNSYSLQVQYQKKPLKLKTQLNHAKSWIKSNDCKVCETVQKCQQSCLSDDQFGIKCSKNCQQLESQYSQDNILAGKVAIISFKSSKQNLTMQFVIAEKLENNQQQIGQINLLEDHIFGSDRILLVRNHEQNVTLFYGDEKLMSNAKILEEYQTINSDQEDPNTFWASQLKIKDEQKENFDIPLIKTNAEISFSTDKLLLPEKIYTKFAKILATNFLADQQCELNKKSQIICNKTADLQKLQNVMIEITLNGVEIQFPIRSLFTTCSNKKCSILIGLSSHKKNIIIGSFIFDIFAIEHISQNNDFNFYRLNNQWGQKFTKIEKYKVKKTNFILALVIIIIKVIWWLGKAIFYLAVFSLFLNCLYHRNQVIGWFIEIKDKLAKKRNKNSSGSEKRGKFRDSARFISSYHDTIDQEDLDQY